MRLIRPRSQRVTVTVRAPEPIGTGTVSSLNAQAGEGIRGHRGAVRYGEPTPGSRAKFGGYVFPPDLFVGYDPRKVAGGAVRSQPGRLPASAPPSDTYSPLLAAMANLSASRGGLPGGQ